MRKTRLQMEWCLNCHRQPEKFLRPKEQVFNMTYQQPSAERAVEWHGKKFTSQVELGKVLAQNYQPALCAGHNQLLHVPPLKWE